jgi:tetratricopeptide (TPR) repeat protein
VSRSVHETRRDLDEVRRWEFGSGGSPEDEVWLVEDRLSAKRRYKVRADRHRGAHAPLDGAMNVAVISEPETDHVHHPLSEEDIRGLLALLPADVRAFTRAVRLRTGLCEDDMRAEDTEPDPMTGRHGYQRDGGIWAPRLAGRFRPGAAEIDLFAFVYDERALRVPEVQTALLWLDRAETLAHEVAHAWDESARSGGDRWASDEEERAERYAEESAQAWTSEYAAAYFERAHPERARAYEEWVLRHVGIPIPLARVAEDLDHSFWGVHIGLREVCAAWNDADAPDLRVELAPELHHVDDHAPARQILELVLAADPEHRGATILMGDIAVHEEDWGRALRWTERALRLAPDDLDAHEDRVDALAGSERWAEAAAAATRGLEIEASEAAGAHGRLRLERARCFIETGDFSQADSDLDVVVGEQVPRRAAAARALRAESLVRRGRWEDALAEASDALRARTPPWPAAVLTAAAWEAAARLGRTDRAHGLTERHVELLRRNRRGAWVDRLLELGMEPTSERPTRRQSALRRRP